MDSSSGLLAMSGSSCAGMSDFTAMKTPPPPQSDRSFLNTVYSEGKYEYVGSSGLSFDSQPKIMSGFKLSMWLAKMVARSELLTADRNASEPVEIYVGLIRINNQIYQGSLAFD